ncbi:MAG: HupE/UreJ family protein [Elusimicrobiota bacterium]
MRLRQSACRLAAGAASCFLLAVPAIAHAPSGDPDARAFYFGICEILQHPVHLLPIFCFGLWVGRRGDAQAVRAARSFILAQAAGIALGACAVAVPWAPTCVLISMVVFGLALALRLRGPGWVVVGSALFFGGCHGYVSAKGLSGTLMGTLGYGGGLLLVTGALLFYAFMLAGRIKAFVWQIALRVFGSWIAAGGLLLLALELRRVFPP